MAEPWQYKPCPFCGAPMDADLNMVAEGDGRWQQIVCGACGARGPEVKRCLPFATALQSWNHRADAHGVAVAEAPSSERATCPAHGGDYHWTLDCPECVKDARERGMPIGTYYSRVRPTLRPSGVEASLHETFSAPPPPPPPPSK